MTIPPNVIEAARKAWKYADDDETARRVILALASDLPESAVRVAYKRLKEEADARGGQITYDVVSAAIIAALKDVAGDSP